MLVFKLAYRHGNGEVEGFAVAAFDAAAARRQAVDKVREKVSHTPHAFDPARLIESEKGLSADERAIVRADWELENAG